MSTTDAYSVVIVCSGIHMGLHPNWVRMGSRVKHFRILYFIYGGAVNDGRNSRSLDPSQRMSFPSEQFNRIGEGLGAVGGLLGEEEEE